MVYCVNAALLWGGGFFAQKGAVDFSGGYVIHLSAGVRRLRRRAPSSDRAVGRTARTPSRAT